MLSLSSIQRKAIVHYAQKHQAESHGTKAYVENYNALANQTLVDQMHAVKRPELIALLKDFLAHAISMEPSMPPETYNAREFKAYVLMQRIAKTIENEFTGDTE